MRAAAGMQESAKKDEIREEACACVRVLRRQQCARACAQQHERRAAQRARAHARALYGSARAAARTKSSSARAHVCSARAVAGKVCAGKAGRCAGVVAGRQKRKRREEEMQRGEAGEVKGKRHAMVWQV